MKTLLSAAFVAAFALSAVSLLPQASAAPADCVLAGEIPGVVYFGMANGRCYELASCPQDGGTVYGFQRVDSDECVPLVWVAPCQTGVGYSVKVYFDSDGAGGDPPQEHYLLCDGNPPPPQHPLTGPCGPYGRGTGVFLPSGTEVACFDPAIIPDPDDYGVAACSQLGGDLVDNPQWIGIAIDGQCLAVGTCQYAGNISVGAYRNESEWVCLPIW